MDQNYTLISKSLSYQLRHNLHNIPETLPDGYVPVDVILKQRGLRGVTVEDVMHVVETNEKKRFQLEMKGDRLCIRAQQGHSHEAGNVIDMAQVLRKIAEPVDYCAHGTTRTAYEKIKKEGLSRMNRTHVHFASLPHATSGFRRSSEVLIHLNMRKAMADGIEFYQSGNDVILSAGDKNGMISPKYFDQVEFV